MQKSPRQQTGFSMIGVAIVVAVVLLIGVIVAKALDSNRAKDQQSTQQTSTQHNNSSSASQPSAAAPTVATMDIKELGIKIFLDDKTKDDTYHYASPDQNGDYASLFNPTMEKIDSANPNCNVNAGYIGKLERSKDPTYFSHGSERVMVNNTTSFRIGDYYYVYTPSDFECSQDKSTAEQRLTYEQDFQTVLKSIQKD